MFPPIVHILSALLAQCAMYSVQSTSGPDCGILGTAGAIAYGLSQNGAICGEVGMCNGDQLPFVRFAGGPLTVLTAVGAAEVGEALAVNSAGVVIGHVDTSSLSFRYHNGNVVWLSPLPGDAISDALAINESGNIAGSSTGTSLRACAWLDGTATDLNLPLGPNSVAADINDYSQICGWMGVVPGLQFVVHAFISSNGVVTDLGVPPGAIATAATAINNHGDACGYFTVPDAGKAGFLRRPCAWINGQFIDLGTLPGLVGGLALDITDALEIVGYCTEETGVAIAPFLWRDGVMYDLNDLVTPGSPFMSTARAINNAGQIAGAAHVFGSDPHGVAFLLTPALPAHAGDSNCDDAVDVDDLLSVIIHWNPQGPVGGNPADLNRDNKIDHWDIIEVILHWGQ